MDQIAPTLAAALRERRNIIADVASRGQPEQHMAWLKKISEHIEQLRQQLPAQTHPQLRHFLERCSYDKALEFIEADQ